MRIFFRCRGGKFHGWGNIVRLSNIAQYLFEKNKKIFFIYEGDVFVKKYLNNFKFKKIKLKEDINYLDEIKIINKIKKPDYTIMEMLDLNIDLQKFYNKISNKFVILDDILDKSYYSDYLISCQDHPTKIIENLNKLSKTIVKVNSNFFPFSKKILQISKKKQENKKKNLLVFLGGGDYSSAYIKIAKALKKLKFKESTFVLSKSNFNSLKKEINLIYPKIKLLNGTKNDGKVFYEHKIAIVSGGYTKFEAALFNLPLAMINTQWHQLELSKSFSQKTGCIDLGHYSRLTINDIIKTLQKLSNNQYRFKILKNYKKVVSPYGLDKILKIIGITN